MDEKDKIIASLRKQLAEATSKNNALEQENSLLKYELERENNSIFTDWKEERFCKIRAKNSLKRYYNA